MQKIINNFLDKYDKETTRVLEILPGTVSWSLILFPILGSFWIPHYVAYYAILFNIFWFYKSATLAFASLLSHFKIKAAQIYNWLEDVKQQRNWQKIHHLVIVPTYKEPLTTIEKGIDSIVNQNYPKEKISVVLATEEREKEAKQKIKILSLKYKGVFANFITTSHPDLPGEVKGKSSNQAWAGKVAKKLLVDQQGLDIDWITVTSKDADVVFHPNYLACLSYNFLTNKDRHFRFWQPALVFYNNIWRVPAPIRVVNTFCTVWDIALLSRKDKLINFSVYSLSLKLLDSVGYWDTDVIPEDYRIFFKTFFAHNGKIEVEPIFLPVSADAAESTTYFKTMINQYEQMKRWAWGTADDAYIIKNWLRAPFPSFFDKTIRIFRVLADHWLWSIYWFVLTLGVNLPIFLNPLFAQTVTGRNLPKLSFIILTVCGLFLAVVLYVDFANRPRRLKKATVFQKILSLAEFILMPLTGFFFSALPGIDAHTRLMFGKYIEYRVTEKV